MICNNSITYHYRGLKKQSSVVGTGYCGRHCEQHCGRHCGQASVPVGLWLQSDHVFWRWRLSPNENAYLHQWCVSALKKNNAPGYDLYIADVSLKKIAKHIWILLTLLDVVHSCCLGDWRSVYLYIVGGFWMETNVPQCCKGYKENTLYQSTASWSLLTYLKSYTVESWNLYKI